MVTSKVNASDWTIMTTAIAFITKGNSMYGQREYKGRNFVTVLFNTGNKDDLPEFEKLITKILSDESLDEELTNEGN